MIRPTSAPSYEDPLRRVDSLVDLCSESGFNNAAIREIWNGVRMFLDQTGCPRNYVADAEALCLAKALALCGFKEEAARSCALAHSARPFGGCLPAAQLSTAGLMALALGVLRGVERPALVPGFCIVLDGEPLSRSGFLSLDFAFWPMIRTLLRDALQILNSACRPGAVMMKNWSKSGAKKRIAAWRGEVACLFADLAGMDTAHRLIWAST